MAFDPTLVAFAQWLISQGIGVTVAVCVLYLIGRKIDQQNGQLDALTVAITKLSTLVESHWPPIGPGAHI